MHVLTLVTIKHRVIRKEWVLFDKKSSNSQVSGYL